VDSKAFNELTDQVIEFSNKIDELENKMESENLGQDVDWGDMFMFQDVKPEELVDSREKRLLMNQFLSETFQEGIILGKLDSNTFYMRYALGMELNSEGEQGEVFKGRRWTYCVAQRDNVYVKWWKYKCSSFVEDSSKNLPVKQRVDKMLKEIIAFKGIWDSDPDPFVNCGLIQDSFNEDEENEVEGFF